MLSTNEYGFDLFEYFWNEDTGTHRRRIATFRRLEDAMQFKSIKDSENQAEDSVWYTVFDNDAETIVAVLPVESTNLPEVLP